MKGWRQFRMFALVGVAGFVVDVTALYSAALVLNWYAARLVSFFLAASVTWYLNRISTFRQGRPLQQSPNAWRTEFGRYVIMVSAGALLNYAIYAGIVHWSNHFAAPFLGVASGSLGGMMLNFVNVRRWVFRSVNGS